MYNNAPEAGLASLLASRGRNGDSVLVHMTPDELQGLQKLAYAAGGQLTINPETGLPEANFLKKLLPAIAGFALGPAGFGLFGSALTAGLAVGATTALIEGDLKKGLMAGLGAYGGASLGAGLKSAGEAAAKAAAESGQKAVLSEVAKEQAAQKATELGLTEAVTATPSAFTQGFTTPTFGTASKLANVGVAELGTQAAPASLAAPSFSTAPTVANVGAQELGVQAAPSYLSTPPSLNYADALAAAPVPEIAAPTFMSGIKALATPEGRSAFGQSMGGGYTSPTAQKISKAAAFMGISDALSGAQEEDTGYTPEEPMFYIPGARNPLYGKSVDQPYFLPGRYVKGLQNFPGIPTTKPPGMAQGGSTNDAMKAYYESLLAPPSTAQADARRGAVEQYVQQVSQNVQKPISTYYPPAKPGDQGGAGGDGGAGGGGGGIPEDGFRFNPYQDFINTGIGNVYMPNSAGAAGTAGPNFGPQLSQMTSGARRPTVPPAGYVRSPNLASSGLADTEDTSGIAALRPTRPMSPLVEKTVDVGGMYDGVNFGFSGGGVTEGMSGGRYLNGPGDGMSDDIEANIEGKQEARLADGEFVIPADVVSHIGNGSSNAGAKKLHKMMDRIRLARTGKERQSPQVNTDKYLPA